MFRMPIATLFEMSPGQEADLFLLMTVKEELKTKTGKPYFRVGFRDGTREVSFPDLGRFALGRRLPRPLDARRVL